jgi:glycine oxidase
METPDFLVIGGGIIGCALARELARESRRVVVLDSGPAGGGASSAAAGLLPPNFGAPAGDAQAELCYQSAALYESWVDELRGEGAGDVGFRRPGLIDVWTGAGMEEQQRAWHAQHPRPGSRVELLSAKELRRREPALVPGLRGATFYADYGVVDPARLTRAVAGVAERAGVILREHQAVRRLVRQGDRITEVVADSARYRPGVVVLCAGAYSGTLASQAGLELPVRPVKGQMLRAGCRVSPVGTPLSAGNALFLPRSDGRLTLGVTVEEAGFDTRVTLAGLQSILNGTSALVPAVGTMPFERAWAGLRPATPDGWPYLGPLAPVRNLWVSTGHFRKGILLAPLCARLVARSLLAGRAEEALAPFTPARIRTE